MITQSFVERKDLMIEIEKNLSNNNGPSTIFLHGAGGAGKTSLAKWVHQSKEFKNVFNKVFWLTLGRDCDILKKINDCIELFDPTLRKFAEKYEAANFLQDKLYNNKILIILDDLWNFEDLQYFQPPTGSHSRILVTTRHSGQINKKYVAMRVDKMNQEEAVGLLTEGLSLTFSPNEKIQLAELAKNELLFWPLLLKLGQGTLNIYLNGGMVLSSSITNFRNYFKQNGITSLDPDNSEDRELALHISMKYSIDAFSPDEQKYIKTLGIFAINNTLHPETVERWWNHAYKLNKTNTKLFLGKLFSASILNSLDFTKCCFTIHDVIHEWLHKQLDAIYLNNHNSFLWSQIKTRAATDFPENEPYLWKYLFYHMEKAGEAWQKRMTDTAKDLLFYAKQSKLGNPTDCIHDLNRMVELFKKDPIFPLLKRRMESLTHLLDECDDIQETVQCLHTRLQHDHELKELLPSLNINQYMPYLEPIHPLPDQPPLDRHRDEIGHTHRIASIRITRDGDKMITGSDDSTIKIWDIESKKLLKTLRGHRGNVLGVAVSPDSKLVASAGADQSLLLWEIENGSFQRLAGHTGTVSWCDFHPNGNYLVSASYDNTLILWDVKEKKIIHHLKGHTKEILDCAFSPDGSYIASTSEDEKIILWETETGNIYKTYRAHDGLISEFSFSADGRYVASVGYDALIVRNPKNHRIVFKQKQTDTGFISCVFGTKGNIIITGMVDGSIIVWSCPGGKRLFTLKEHKESVIHCAIHPDGKRMVSVSGDRSIILWDLTTKSMVYQIMEEWNAYYGTSFSPDGRLLAAASHKNGLTIWDWQKNTIEKELIMEAKHLNEYNNAWDGRFFPDGQKLAAVFVDTVCLWETASWKLLWTKKINEDEETYCLSINHDGDHIVVGASDYNLHIFDLQGTIINTLEGHTGYVFDCYFHPKNSNLVIAAYTDETLRLWNIKENKEVHTMHGHTEDLYGCAVHPNGRGYSVSNDGTMREWNLETGKEIHCFKGHKALIYGLAIHPEKNWAATASEDHTLKIWDLETKACLMTFHANDHLSKCAFHPTEPIIAVTGGCGVYFLRWVE
ncbi:MAG: NB-ARC domain-containing protein [Magnetococcus sp. YQC-5]